jgi:hypothetical protein
VSARLRVAGLGVAFGFILSRVGFSSWDEVHRMFTFADLRLVLAFGTAVAALALAWRLALGLAGARFAPNPWHRGAIPGGLIFGAGWALCGACPSIALVQLGEGQLGAGWTLAGIVLGNALYGALNARLLRWPNATCA